MNEPFFMDGAHFCGGSPADFLSDPQGSDVGGGAADGFDVRVGDRGDARGDGDEHGGVRLEAAGASGEVRKEVGGKRHGIGRVQNAAFRLRKERARASRRGALVWRATRQVDRGGIRPKIVVSPSREAGTTAVADGPPASDRAKEARLMLGALIKLWNKRFSVTPPDIKSIEKKYEEHRENVEKIEETTRQVRLWRIRLKTLTDEPTGNVVRDIAA